MRAVPFDACHIILIAGCCVKTVSCIAATNHSVEPVMSDMSCSYIYCCRLLLLKCFLSKSEKKSSIDRLVKLHVPGFRSVCKVCRSLTCKLRLNHNHQSVGRARNSCLNKIMFIRCLLYTSPSPRDRQKSRMPSSA